jgi:hypothetical protein
VKVHLLSLEEELSRYFSDYVKLFLLIKSPFIFYVVNISTISQEEFIDVIISTAIRSEFSFFSERLVAYTALANVV